MSSTGYDLTSQPRTTVFTSISYTAQVFGDFTAKNHSHYFHIRHRPRLRHTVEFATAIMEDCSTYILPCDLREADPRILQLGTILFRPTDTYNVTHFSAKDLAKAAKVGIHQYVERDVHIMQPLLFDEVNYLFPVHPNQLGKFKGERVPRYRLNTIEVVHFTDPPAGKQLAAMLTAHPDIKDHLKVHRAPIYMVTGIMVGWDVHFRAEPTQMPTRTLERYQRHESNLRVEPEAQNAVSFVLNQSRQHQDKGLPKDFFHVRHGEDHTIPRSMSIVPRRDTDRGVRMALKPGRVLFAYKLTKIDIGKWMGTTAKPSADPVLTRQGYMVRYRDFPTGHIYHDRVEEPKLTNFDCVYGGW